MAYVALEHGRTNRRNSCPASVEGIGAVEFQSHSSTDSPLRASSERLAPRKTVTFGTVEVREHEYILGCHQAGESAVIPLTIAWHASSIATVSLEDFEAYKQSTPYASMQWQPTKEQWSRLGRMGFGAEELREAKAYCDSIRQLKLYEPEVVSKCVFPASSPSKPKVDSTGSRLRRGFFNRLLHRPGVFVKKRGPSFDDN